MSNQEICHYMKNSKEGNRIRSNRWRENNLEKSRLMQKKTYYSNRQYYLQKRKEYREKNKDKILEYNRIYHKNNPEKSLQYVLKHKKKYNLEFGWDIQDWSLSIRKRDNNKCQICSKPAKHAHHIFYQRYYPLLRFNLNNGISLCKKHHLEIHGRFL